jgi:catechol 2,3-dioxygenase
MGAVHLTVSDLERSLAFYQEALGMAVQARNGATAHLGAGREALAVLTEQRGARAVRNHSGLYHFAILTPSRLALAKSLRRLAELRIPVGGGDHLVSEAVYLSDPDGNGIEIYRDRPRSTWAYEHGQIKMDTLPLDYQSILAELEGDQSAWAGLEPETVLGHMHLHVNDLAQAQRFYRDIVGFDLMLNYGGSALFFSAGGYHHHLGTNTWAGVGAPPAPADAAGLRYYEVRLANAEEQQRLAERLQAGGVAYEARNEGLFVRDPAQNGILFATA